MGKCNPLMFLVICMANTGVAMVPNAQFIKLDIYPKIISSIIAAIGVFTNLANLVKPFLTCFDLAVTEQVTTMNDIWNAKAI
jgi:hypothetical protein